MAISPQLQKRIEAVAWELNQELHGPKGCPPWGTKFVDMEQATTEVGDAIACAMLSQELQQQADAEGHPAGKCGGCGEPIPFEEVAGRLLQARREEVAWQESFGRCRRCRKSFFPQSQALGIAPEDTVSPGVLRKMVYAGSRASSFQQASRDLKEEAELDISDQRIMRATKRIGQERVAERDAATQAWVELPLPERQASPREQVPQVACVEMDGGRLQIRDRKVSEEERRRTQKGDFWREDKVGCLLSIASTVHEEDPCPQIPETLLDLGRIRKISREIKGFCVPDEEESPRDEAVSKRRAGQPEVLVRSVVATREDIHAFGKQLAAAAWRRGFSAASRKAFVADGQDANWIVWRKHFSHYTPILDFIHAVCYVFAAAVAGRSLREAAPTYRQWAQWMWSGKVQHVIDALRVRQQELGLPEKDEEESPRAKVADALRYLENQKSRMHYDAYRRMGLPITSSHIESTIKQINRRVKGTEKFWSEGGAEALLQLAADFLSETNPLATFWRERPAHATGQRHYQTAG